ncbi:ABC transporter permease [Thermophagus xiamenensis]|uniref:ABC-2 type transport system permease protein n=1 Tax=Thermophagus xiamenensis TaxID=385682 RepID=A0A1I2F6N9_9BACT|nr:ABC transporter permease [Thermophagus xiamenensis]SFF00388.1 ABC-2 type transport system permease protein [Thermophagus xiamenensis]
MRILFYLLQKEFIQIYRNKTILRLIFVIPVVQLLILVNAATLEMRKQQLSVVDEDHSPWSKRLISVLDASPFFVVGKNDENVLSAKKKIEKGEIDFLLVIPQGFESSLMSNEQVKIQLLANAINSQQAQLGYAYLQQVIAGLSQSFVKETYGVLPQAGIVTTFSYWYNPELNYKHFMVPGILVVLVSVVGMFLTAMNLVREKEMGTIEQINVTPVRKWQFIVAKLLPFLLIGLFELALGLTIGKLIYQIPIEGSLWLVFAIATLYLTGLLGLGLLLSTISSSQQQVTFVSFFFLLVFILMSGIFTSVDNMPEWGQKLNLLNPLYYFIDLMRAILLKGAGLSDLWKQVTGISVLAVFLFGLAVLNYRKTI